MNDREVRTKRQSDPHRLHDGDDQPFDLVCLSHLRWDFVYQRPQQLLSRCARQQRVFFVEEPIVVDGPSRLELSQRDERLYVVVPYVSNARLNEYVTIVRALLDRMFVEQAIQRYVLWYYTPMAISFTRHLTPLAVVYDCMDELSAFSDAPSVLHERERELFARTDLVFTGGHSLYEVKRMQHPRVYAFPSSVDVPHFAQARSWPADPDDQKDIPHPRLGFFGVIDERLDRELLAGIADARPDWPLVLIGPVVKIDPAELPRRPNLHYLGSKPYADLPAYLSGWDVALLPFVRNEATRFISPTKTPEYLAAGCPVVSTPIRDVVRPYGAQGLVRIAATVPEFVAAIEGALAEHASARQSQVDAFLQQLSWDATWANMQSLIRSTMAAHCSQSVEQPVQRERVVGDRL